MPCRFLEILVSVGDCFYAAPQYTKVGLSKLYRPTVGLPVVSLLICDVNV